MDEEKVTRFVRLTAPHHAKLLRIARAICHDRDNAADLCQEALVRAFKAFDSFRPEAPVLPWLTRILRNIHLDRVKSGRARFEVAEHQLTPGAVDPIAAAPAMTPTPLALAERAQLATWARQELERLPHFQQQAVILCDMEGLSCREAGELMDVPAGTVRSRLFRAREQLRLRLEARLAGSAAPPAEVDSDPPGSRSDQAGEDETAGS